ncbi:MAG: hypothetical protein GQ532_06130 [Methylomarinum sp.]|nr:hypothetical protein [Methylomarinum sp.]
MMKKIIRTYSAVFLLFIQPVVFAGTYLGLEPGVSKQNEVEQVFGKPVRVDVQARRYDYTPLDDDTRRVSIKFRNGTIESIDIYARQTFSKSQYQQWLDLKTPDKSIVDSQGNRIEYYFLQGVALHYQGSDTSLGVSFFSHFDPQMQQQAQNTGRRSEKDYVSAVNKAEESKEWRNLKQIVDEALKIYPQNPFFWKKRAYYYFYSATEPMQIRRKEAIFSAQKAYGFSPTTTYALDLGWLYLQFYDDCNSALPYLEKVEREYGPENPSLYFWMAHCYDKLFYLEKARQYYHRFLAAAPDDDKIPRAKGRLKWLE